jgi:hypothetical protein
MTLAAYMEHEGSFALVITAKATKRVALEKVGVPATAAHPPLWKRDAGVLAWLASIGQNRVAFRLRRRYRPW